jgi:hypothetical protein
VDSATEVDLANGGGGWGACVVKGIVGSG